jgi:DNA-binding NarL/FixJ family response regulator
MSREISVILADDHALVRSALRRLLEDDPEICVVGEAGNGREAVELVQRLAPRVVVMDLAMPVMDGLAATREIVSRAPGTVVLMLSLNAQENCVRKALDAGACGYLLKNASELDLGAAIKAAASGRSVPGGAG